MSSKNDKAWQQLFEQYQIMNAVEQFGLFEITSSQINEHRQARLMTKFDHSDSLPKLFSTHDLSVLPVSRGRYVIGRFEAFHSFEKDKSEVEQVQLPSYLESLNPAHISSEAAATNCAFVTEMLHEFTEEERLFPTVSGRMGSSEIQFSIDHKNNPSKRYQINVNNSQIEIDGGYEGENALWIIEAKTVLANDFLVRQLYYPYRLWSSKIRKPVKLLFLTYSNGIFHLRQYAVDDLAHYNSIRLVQQKRYVIGDHTINMEIIENLFRDTQCVKEPAIPFPQANSFERIINLCELLYQHEQDKLESDEITQSYDFVGRQTHYYVASGRYLGFIQNERRGKQSLYSLTERGRRLFDMPIVQRRIAFAEAILEHEPFSRTFALYLEKRARPNKAEVGAIMRECTLKKYEPSTVDRRAQTVLSWLDWILHLVQRKMRF